MATVSYGCKIINENHIFDHTIEVYRDAVRYLSDIVTLHYKELAAIQKTDSATAQQLRQRFVECLIHGTKEHAAVYSAFDERFYKFPSYLRRDAINTAIGKVFAYRSWVANWEEGGRKGRHPFLNRNQDVMPCFYRKNTFLQNESMIAIKLYNGHDWVWHSVAIRDTDFWYALKNVSEWKESAPVLAKRNRRYELRFAYTKSADQFPQYIKDNEVTTAIGVDLGVNTDAVCSVIQKDGTVTGQTFLNSPVEKDRMDGLLNTIKKAQQNGNYKNNRLWRFVNHYNMAIAVKTAAAIVNYAKQQKAQVIVFEYLKMNGKRRGSKKQRLSLWRKREIQHRVEALASRYGILVSYICAVNTSRLAFDGSGKVLRGRDGGFTTYELCQFQNGKVYNCDLSASKNIGARYFIRVLLKSTSAKELLQVQAKVPELCRRISCVLATLINFHAELVTLKDGKPAA